MPNTQTLHDMQLEVVGYVKAKKWDTIPRTFPDDIALLISECVEALEAFRDNGLKPSTEYTFVLDYEPRGLYEGIKMPMFTRKQLDAIGNTLAKEHNLDFKPPKPCGAGSELADVLIRMLDTCHRYGIDLEYEFRRKMDYNHQRDVLHGGKKI